MILLDRRLYNVHDEHSRLQPKVREMLSMSLMQSNEWYYGPNKYST
jgi:hypothetical protein